MHVTQLSIEGLKLLKPQVFSDERGFFREFYRESLYRELGVGVCFVQDNHSYSRRGVLRGMHFQRTPGQAKLVSVLLGEIFDVAVDIRPDSKTFGRWEGVLLKDSNYEQLFIPEGFAHGFCVLSEEAHVLYKVSSVYDPAEEKEFHFNDPEVGIKWPEVDKIVSLRDQRSPSFREALCACGL